MSKKAVFAIIIGGVFGLLVLGLAGYFFVSTFFNTGDKAVLAMTPTEREYLEPLLAIESSMTEADVFELLGQPTQKVFILAKWQGYGGSLLSEARVYFSDGHPYEVRWIKLGRFIYVRKL